MALANIAIPREEHAGRYVWTEVYVGPSTVAEKRTSERERRHHGLFAKCDLEPGLMFPIAGRRADPKSSQMFHVYEIKTSSGKVLIDGDPSLHPYRSIGSFGLAVAMMANEAASPEVSPNCYFDGGYLCVCRRITKNEELLTYYGPQYEGKRKQAGYTDRRPATMREADLDWWRAVRGKLIMPSAQQKQSVIDNIDKRICTLVREDNARGGHKTSVQTVAGTKLRASSVEECKPSYRADAKPPSSSTNVYSAENESVDDASDSSCTSEEATTRSDVDRPTIVLSPWIVHYICQGKYTWDQRPGKRLFSTSRMPLRINIMCSTDSRHHVTGSQAELVRRLRCLWPTPMDEEPAGGLGGGNIRCTCTVERELTDDERRLIPQEVRLTDAKHTVKLSKVIVLPGQGIKGEVATPKFAMFCKLTTACQRKISSTESLVHGTFGYE